MDIGLNYSDKVFDLSFSDGEVISSDGVVESVLSTLFLSNDWWGNDYNVDKIGSNIMYTIDKSKASDENKEEIKKEIESSLLWVVKDEVADKLNVEIQDGVVEFDINEIKVRFNL